MFDIPIGAHFSIAGGFKQAFEEAVSIGASAMQVFSKAPVFFKLREVTSEETKEVKNLKNRKRIKYAVIHSSYLLNFAHPPNENHFARKSLAEDLENAEKLGADGAVLHLGKSLKMDAGEAEDNFVENIRLILDKTNGLKSKLILENTAGQGTEMGFRLDDLARIYKKLGGHKRVKFCFDTAHAFGAGYDMRDEKAVKKTVKEIDKQLGIKNIACIHLNDSKKELGSRVDRHQDIGYGTISEAGLRLFVKEILEKSGRIIPLILETPQGFDSYEKQIKKVRKWGPAPDL